MLVLYVHVLLVHFILEYISSYMAVIARDMDCYAYSGCLESYSTEDDVYMTPCDQFQNIIHTCNYNSSSTRVPVVYT